MSSEAEQHADFSAIRYAQVWEDADILVPALSLKPDSVVLSIASAGDNALALLAQGPARVIALDLNSAQLACLALRVAAHTTLEHDQLLELMGSRPSTRREALYQRARKHLDAPSRHFWDAHPQEIAAGIGGAGKFERYFGLFRERIIPFVHRRATIERLLTGGTLEQRQRFYADTWNNWRWRLLFKVFFSRSVMGRLGRDPSFFRYVQGSVADRILDRTRYALTTLDPAGNPYLQWILTGTHTSALPYALRPEHFESIRANLHKLEWHQQPVEDFLDRTGVLAIDAANLSDIFEYMSEENTERLLARLVRAARPGARFAYWNMLAPRRRPASLASVLRPLDTEAEALFAQDKAFFYSAFVLEEVIG